jgi:transcriptional regulator with XRE-family HTH domain
MRRRSPSESVRLGRTMPACFASNLRHARRAAGMSQEDLSDACGLQRTYVSLLEQGKRDPRISTVARLADALDIDAGYLLSQRETLCRRLDDSN